MIGSDEHSGSSEPKSLTREELYELAWREPMLRVAERFDVSSSYLRPYKRLLVDVLCSEPKLDEALGAAQSLFHALEKRGFHVCFAPAGERMSRAEVELLDKPIKRNYQRTRWSPDRVTVVYVGTTAIGLTLFEMTEELETVYVSGKYIPVRDLSEQQLRRYTSPHHWRSKEEYASGRLCLQAYCPHYGVKWSRRWQEAKPGSLRGMIPEIVEALEAMAPDLARQEHEATLRFEEERRQWEEQHRRWEAEEERQRVEKATRESRDELLAAIASWEEARRVRDYLASVEGEVGQLTEDEAVFMRGRLELCRQLVGKLDPLALLRAWRTPNERLA